MISKNIKAGLVMLLLCCICCFIVQPVFAAEGTDGSELQLMQAEQLEIQLGPNWAGVAFQLKTDAGLYPGDIIVGQDGVLRLEIGGSSFYTLSAIHSNVAIPVPTQAPATQESEEITETSGTPTVKEDAGSVAGIPILHIVLFAGGLVLAAATLIAMHFTKHRVVNIEDESEEDE